MEANITKMEIPQILLVRELCGEKKYDKAHISI